MSIDGGAILDLLPGEGNREPVGWPGVGAEGDGGNQDQPAAKPMAGVDHQVANCPGIVVEIKILHHADLTIFGLDRKTVHASD
ncbi:MAG TPA: hypothetical protein VNE83_00300 [Terriglobales bacterium]|nr:hypothetical protein [Terriglobales bacterium]